MFRLLILTLAAVAGINASALAWTNVEEMNHQIDQTNFIVGNGCSGTLISVEYKLVVTAHHCVDGYIKKVTRDIVGKDGKIEKVQFERLERVTIQQRDYKRFDNVGAVSYQTEIVAYKQGRDLALLQLIGDNLRSTIAAPVLQAGGDIFRGQGVIAVGNPRMLDASVTVGVVSSTSRTFQVPWALGEKVPMVQFDANIQPGSSGGALFTNEGIYIGTTVAAFPGSDLSLAVPVFELHDLLLESCMASVYDPEADDKACEAEKNGEEKPAGSGGEE